MYLHKTDDPLDSTPQIPLDDHRVIVQRKPILPLSVGLDNCY